MMNDQNVDSEKLGSSPVSMGEFRDEERLKTQVDAFKDEDRQKPQVEAESFRGLIIDEVQMGNRNSGIAVTFNSRNSN